MRSRFNIWFVIHALLHVLLIPAIFLIPWYWLALIFVLLRVQDALFGGCILNYFEYGTTRVRWTEQNLARFFPKWCLPYFSFLMDWFFPVLLVYLAYLIQ